MSMHQKIVDEVPQLARGRVWCLSCGNTHLVNAAHCLATGWPRCCGQTMTIDSPEEREALAKKRARAAGSARPE